MNYFITRRNENFKFLNELLQPLNSFIINIQSHVNAKPSWFGFPITLKAKYAQLQRELINYLESNKIGTRPLFAGNLIHQPMYQKRNYRIIGNLENSNIVLNNTFWVGIWPRLGKPHMEYIASTILKFFSSKGMI